MSPIPSAANAYSQYRCPTGSSNQSGHGAQRTNDSQNLVKLMRIVENYVNGEKKKFMHCQSRNPHQDICGSRGSCVESRWEHDGVYIKYIKIIIHILSLKIIHISPLSFSSAHSLAACGLGAVDAQF
ncbi:hypothetical protein VE01_00345 [Pseudogymnoascus verrucosus]|uniref:Uncharacterized protein n=1 Tax=Pseudogymnoascus verrucosus TaxID=342668 RepID=A0A2P2SXK4_9PEZI|nr:uncharacterized protein VE01_00345 [Pseudogymnoascus verrucosus]OBU01567.1 hypothetical protein VE01_00345 [Pseudogymnoascus verrucosus]